MDDLVRWLGEQLDEDQRIAEAARGHLEGRWSHDASIPNGYVYDERGQAVVYDESAPLPEEAAHIAAHDPARVLREIDAKRQVLAEYEQAARYAKTTWGQSNADQSRARTLGKVVRLLAAVCADRPGYREEWRP